MKAKISLSILILGLALSLSLACSKGSSDAQISSQVQGKLASDANIQNKQIGVQSANGVVTLSGNVATDIERASAANDAAEIPGVKTVINNLQVQPQTAQAQTPAQTASETATPATTPVEPPRNESGRTQRHSAPARSSRTPAYSAAHANSAPVDRTVVTSPVASNVAPAAPAPTTGPIDTTPAPPPKPAPVTIPDGTEIAIRLVDPLDSEKN